MRTFRYFAILSIFHVSVQLMMTIAVKYQIPFDEDESFWNQRGEEEISRAEEVHANTNNAIAKNLILSIGDGMSLSTVFAARTYEGQKIKNTSGEENSLHFENFPHIALLKTYSTSDQTPDSASTAFAMMSGVKTSNSILGYDKSANKSTCSPEKLKKLSTIIDWALKAEKSVGIVTTDRVTGATPAAAYGHVTNRDWQNDRTAISPCKDLARQLIEDNIDINVILGGGRSDFIPFHTITGNVTADIGRNDSRNLIHTWKKKMKDKNMRYKYVSTKDDLSSVDGHIVEYLLGLFTLEKIPGIHKRELTVPSLAEMTEKAIEILSKNKRGFFLLIEGGNIDVAHHYNLAEQAIQATLEFNKAVKMADKMTADSETLFIVTADHSHVFTVGGYSERGNDILGFSTDEEALDGAPSTSLGYNNGPGYINRSRPNITSNDLGISFEYTGGKPTEYESHSAEDVPLYAKGPRSHLFHGVHEQSYVGHVLAYAACIGRYSKNSCISSSAHRVLSPHNIFAFLPFSLSIIYITAYCNYVSYSL